jgi:hypothetical protein
MNMKNLNPRSRGLSEHRVFSYEECGIPAHMPGWRHQWEEDCGKKCQRWVGTRDSTGCCEHEGCNIAVFTRTLVSILHSQWRNHHLFRRKNRMVQPDSLNVGLNVKIGKYSSNPWPEVGGGTSCHHGAEVDRARRSSNSGDPFCSYRAGERCARPV